MEFCSPPSSSSSVSSSPRLSCLSSSTSTSLSSAFSGSELSSLPSPSLSPAPRDIPSDFTSPGAKTHAFFASAFATRPPSPLSSLPHSPNASTSTITTPKVPLLVPRVTTSETSDVTKKRDFLWIDLPQRSVQDLSATSSPTSAQPPDESTPKIPSVTPTPQMQEELVVGAIIRARTSPRSRTVSTDNSGILTSSSASSPLTQSPVSQLSGLPETTTSHTVSFSGLPLESPDSGVPMLTVHPPKSSSGTTLRLKAPLGTGAFSSVWLAEDLSDDPLVLRSRRSLRNLRQGSLPLSRNNSLNKVRVPGVRPVGAGKQLFVEQERSGTSSSLHSLSAGSTLPASRIVALKMTARSMFVPCSDRGQELQRDRTRVSFVREVEVLRHISHPNITKLLTHLTTPSYHVLVLPYISGGDLLGLVNNDEAHNQLGESLLRRMWCELCKAIGWMHGVGLVHRDVKLENILLTTPFPFGSAGPPTGPLIKLTDFGLSRFIDTAAPMLSTRCGSEAYAAPELVISGGKYDARETDAWACGVVLYALCVRRLPFGEGAAGPGDGGRIGREGGARAANAARRHWLMSIARGEWEWPEPRSPSALVSSEGEGESVALKNVEGESEHDGDKPEADTNAEELRGWRLVESQGARRIVARLLVRERSRREKIAELWNDQWMGGKGTSAGTGSESARPIADVETPSTGGDDAESDSNSDTSNGFRSDLDVEGFDDEDLEEEDDDVNDDGLLLDQDGIDNIARQEVQ